ncbi:hypothetical protein ACOSQ3_002216 [Xanthoceras sorbifolium]
MDISRSIFTNEKQSLLKRSSHEGEEMHEEEEISNSKRTLSWLPNSSQMDISRSIFTNEKQRLLKRSSHEGEEMHEEEEISNSKRTLSWLPNR